MTKKNFLTLCQCRLQSQRSITILVLALKLHFYVSTIYRCLSINKSHFSQVYNAYVNLGDIFTHLVGRIKIFLSLRWPCGLKIES